MKRSTVVLLLLSIVSLLLTGLGLSYRLLRLGLEAAQTSTEQRLGAIGMTLAEALRRGSDTTLLGPVAHDSQLEAAYLLDQSLRPVEDKHTVSLLRVDPDRALRALRGQPQVGLAYRLELDDEPDNSEPNRARKFWRVIFRCSVAVSSSFWCWKPRSALPTCPSDCGGRRWRRRAWQPFWARWHLC
ncbi:MAG: hypothetical protein U0787_03020 [Polyangia bacterium]